MLPFVTSELEAKLALELQIPVYGPDPQLAQLGTKTGSREVFAAAGVDLPVGIHGVHTEKDLVEAATEIHASTGARKFIVKENEGVSGLGNAILELAPMRGSQGPPRSPRAARAGRPDVGRAVVP